MPSALLNVMINAAKKASIKIRRDFNELENLQVSTKGPGDFVTSADIRTQKIIIDELTKRDYFDRNRQLSPLVSAKDAYLLDTSNITSDDGLKIIIQIISRKLEK